ncbi:MAG: hypothetical protein IPF83_06170 [Rhodanobacteraceae bacterium]|nr:hypothetical protein [Rhodanobacteraceae bacterium]
MHAGLRNDRERRGRRHGPRIEVALTLHAAERIGLPLPGNAQLLALDGVQLDAQAVNALYRDAAGTTWIEVPRGVHRAALRFLDCGSRPDRAGVPDGARPCALQR